MARFTVGLWLAALLLVPATTRAEGEPDPWFTSLAAGKRAAAGTDRLLFVYLDPSLREGEIEVAGTALSEVALRAAADHFVVVRLPAGVDDLESVRIRTRYELLDSVGAGVVIDVRGALFGRVTSASTDELLATLQAAEGLAEQYRRRTAQLDARANDDALRELAALHLEHYAFEQAVLTLGQIDRGGDLSSGELFGYARGLARLGRLDAAERVFRRLLVEYPEDPDTPMVRLWLATLRICPARVTLLRLGRDDPELREQGLDAVNALLAERRAAGDVGGEAAARYHLLCFVHNQAEQVAQCTWIVENDPSGLVAGSAWWNLAELAVQWNDPELAVLHLRSLIAARQNDEAYAEPARQYLQELEPYASNLDTTEVRPFGVRVELSDDDPEPGSALTLTVHLTNRSEHAFHDVAIGVLTAGPARLTSNSSERVPRLGAHADVTAAFDLTIEYAGTLHLLVTVQRTDVEETGHNVVRHVRIDVLD